jgi:hypothetical protein
MPFTQAVTRGFRAFDHFNQDPENRRFTFIACFCCIFLGVAMFSHAYMEYVYWPQQNHGYTHTGREYTEWDQNGRVVEHIVFDEAGNEVSHEFYP